MFDIIIKNATIIDGSGKEGFTADIAISKNRITKIGKIEESGRQVIDAKNLIVSPGFVDCHSHSDYYLIINPLAESKVRQGVTTEIGGNCGYSAAPLSGEALEERKNAYQKAYNLEHDWKDVKGYYNRLEAQGVSLNFALLIGHNTIRSSVIGGGSREATGKEMAQMKEMIQQAMKEGAIGISTGLAYGPACFAKKEELVELCKEVQKSNGIFTVHMRSEGKGLLEAIKESIYIAKEAEMPLQISHLKTYGEENWYKLDSAFELIEKARAEGLDATCDRYPYTAANTGLHNVLPNWVLDGGIKRELERLKDNAEREKIRKELQQAKKDMWDKIMISEVITEKNKIYEGKRVSEAAGIAKKEPIEFVFDILVEDEIAVDAIFFKMSEENLKRVLIKPYVMIGSDSGARADYGALGRGRSHPRTFGTFPRVLGRYVREEKILDLPSAIKKMTSEPCKKFNIKERGLIKEGYFADIVIFNPDTIADTATYENPHKYPTGVEYVMVNGKVTVEKGKHLGAKAGRVIRL
ncbi:MAG TPA: D-aminoacylase [Thermodesulfobacteriota bacterium]|nr:D-aminoacylase [Thermodesulfobacteriota bacterium]